MSGSAATALRSSPASAQSAAARSGSAWVETWASAPQQPNDPGSGPEGGLLTLDGQTIRQVVRISTGGQAIQIRLSNEYSNAPTVIGDVHVAVAANPGTATGAIVAGTDHVVTFGGRTGVTLAQNGAAVSDPVSMPVGPLASLSVSIYVASGTVPATLHVTSQQTNFIASCDQAASADLGSGTRTGIHYLLSAVDSYRPAGATVIAFGDSITDGYRSTIDASHRWPDFLAQRFQGRAALRTLGIANVGISGNRLLGDGTGPNAQARFDRDVLAAPQGRYLVMLLGINDIGSGELNHVPPPTPETLEQVYRELIARAHRAGLLVYGATLTPFQGSFYYSDDGEAVRQAVNRFIRTGGAFDGVIDFDKALRDPNRPLRLLPAYNSGDDLHPNDNGYVAMANSVPLELFQPPASGRD